MTVPFTSQLVCHGSTHIDTVTKQIDQSITELALQLDHKKIVTNYKASPSDI